MKNFLQKLITPFLPTYHVVFIMYNMVPGAFNKKKTQHDFARGAQTEAEAFFEKAVNKTDEMKLMPVQIELKRGKKVIRSQKFGPFEQMKSVDIVK